LITVRPELRGQLLLTATQNHASCASSSVYVAERVVWDCILGVVVYVLIFQLKENDNVCAASRHLGLTKCEHDLMWWRISYRR